MKQNTDSSAMPHWILQPNGGVAEFLVIDHADKLTAD